MIHTSFARGGELRSAAKPLGDVAQNTGVQKLESRDRCAETKAARGELGELSHGCGLAHRQLKKLSACLASWLIKSMEIDDDVRRLECEHKEQSAV